MNTQNEGKCFALKNIAASCKAYPLTAVILLILMFPAAALLVSELSAGGISLAGFFAFLLTILLFFPMYVLIYALTRHGKSFFLRLFWLFIPLYIIIMIASALVSNSMFLILKTTIYGAYTLVTHILCGSVIFFLGRNDGAKFPKESKQPTYMYLWTAFLALAVFLGCLGTIEKIGNKLAAGVTDIVSSSEQESEDAGVEIVCPCVDIDTDYDKVVSSDGRELTCALWDESCECGRFYAACAQDNHPYTGWAEYRNAGKLVRKVYYKNGDVEQDTVMEFPKGGQVYERSFVYDGKEFEEYDSADGEIIEQTVRKTDENGNVSSYTVYYKEYGVIGYVDRDKSVRGLRDKVIGFVGEKVQMVCGVRNYIAYISGGTLKNFRGKTLGEYTEDGNHIVLDDGRTLGFKCGSENLAYDKHGNIIGAAIIRKGEEDGFVVGLDEDGNAKNNRDTFSPHDKFGDVELLMQN